MVQITPVSTAWACQQIPAPRARNGGMGPSGDARGRLLSVRRVGRPPDPDRIFAESSCTAGAWPQIQIVQLCACALIEAGCAGGHGEQVVSVTDAATASALLI